MDIEVQTEAYMTLCAFGSIEERRVPVRTLLFDCSNNCSFLREKNWKKWRQHNPRTPALLRNTATRARHKRSESVGLEQRSTVLHLNLPNYKCPPAYTLRFPPLRSSIRQREWESFE